jgi:hypothetical protein
MARLLDAVRGENMRELALGMAGLVVASQAFGGVSMKAVTTGGAGGSREPVTTIVQAEGDSVRLDRSGATGPYGQGYVVSTDGGLTMYMVNPAEKSYVKLDIEKLLDTVGGMMDSMKQFMQVNVIQHKVEKLVDEDGPKMLGYPTRHCKFVTTLVTETTVFGRKKTNSTVTEQELWTTTKIATPGLALWQKLQSQKTGFADMDKVIESEKAKGIKGIPLKSISSSSSDGKGQVKTVMEVAEVKEERIGKEVFTIPSDYTEKKMEMPEDSEQGAGKEATGDSDASKDAPSAVDAFLKSFNKKR